MATTPNTTTTTPPSTPIIHVPLNYDNLNESWCELQYKSGCSSTGSISHLHHSVNPEVLEKLLQEAQKESSPNRNNHNYLPERPSPILASNRTEMLDTNLINSEQNKSSLLYYLPNPDDTSTPILVEYDSSSSNILSPINLDSPPVTKFKEFKSNCTKISTTTATTKSAVTNSTILIECTNCQDHKKQIDLLLEKQLDQEKQILKLKKEYEEKLLTKSPEFTLSMQSSSISTSSDNESEATIKQQKNKTLAFLNQTSLQLQEQQPNQSKRQQVNDSSSSSSSSITTNQQHTLTRDIHSFSSPIGPAGYFKNDLTTTYSSGIYNYNESTEWMKQWSSRPQTQPPKEWNFVHPNSSKSKYNTNMLNKTINNEIEDTNTIRKFLNRENIGKIIFTHMASFIVGATLMFLVLKRHLNLRSSIYFV